MRQTSGEPPLQTVPRGQYLLEQLELAGDADERIALDKLPIVSNNPPRLIKRRRTEHEYAAADSQCHDHDTPHNQHGSINSTCIPELPHPVSPIYLRNRPATETE